MGVYGAGFLGVKHALGTRAQAGLARLVLIFFQTLDQGSRNLRYALVLSGSTDGIATFR